MIKIPSWCRVIAALPECNFQQYVVAQHLKQSQPSVFNTLKVLKEKSGDDVYNFVRNVKDGESDFTEKGMRIYETAKRIIAEIQSLNDQLK